MEQSSIISEGIIQNDPIAILNSTPINKLTTSLEIKTDDLLLLNESKERSIRHKSVHLSILKIKEKKNDALISSSLKRINDICPLIRTEIIKLIGYLIREGNFNLTNDLFNQLKIENNQLILVIFKIINELLIIKKKEFIKLIKENVQLLIDSYEIKNSKIKEECVVLLFRMYELNLVPLKKINKFIHLAEKPLFKKMVDEIISDFPVETKEEEYPYGFIFYDERILIELFKTNEHILNRINYTDTHTEAFLDSLLKKESNSLISLQILNSLYICINFNKLIQIINNNKESTNVLEKVILNSKYDISEAEELLILLIRINKEYDILELILKYIRNNMIFINYVSQLVTSSTINRVIKYFDVDYDGDIIYQCYKFMWLVMKEEPFTFIKYTKPIGDYCELMNFMIYLNKKLVNYSDNELILRNNEITLEGSINQKMNDFMVYLIHYLINFINLTKKEELIIYLNLVKELKIKPHKSILNFNIKELKINHQLIFELLMENTELLVKKEKEIKYLRRINVFSRMKELVGTDKEMVIKYFIGFMGINELIFLENKVKNKELKELLRKSMVNNKRNQLVTDENVNTTFI